MTPVFPIMTGSHFMEQMEFFKEEYPALLNVAHGLSLLWRFHLVGKVSGRTWKANRTALTQTMGGVPLKFLTEVDVVRHIDARRTGTVGHSFAGPQTIRHDLQVLTLMLNWLAKGKRKKWILEDVHFERFELPEHNPLEDIKRPKTKPRDVLVYPYDVSRLTDICTDKMRKRIYFAFDTGMNECDLRALRVTDYNSIRNTFQFYRRKTGVWVEVAASDRCREYTMEAICNGWQFIIPDWTNHNNEWQRLKRRLKLDFQWRDIRKTTVNEAIDHGGIKAGQSMAGHATPRTTEVHYAVNRGYNLKPIVRRIERKFK